MRDRHWTLLMQTTGKQFVMDEKFCLGDLLALEVSPQPFHTSNPTLVTD